MLADEAATMNDCVECHEVEKFHNCTTCHDEHGSAEMAKVPFNQLVLLAGDLPEPGYIPVNDILPYRDQPGTQVALLDLLAQRGVTDLERVALFSNDGGVVTIERPNLTQSALLMPHVDGIRFADENLHVSTWLKGISRIVVVGADKPLTIDGQPTSIGRLLLRVTRSAITGQADVMFKSPDDGQVRKARTASRIEGAPIEDLVGFNPILVRDAQGQEHALSADEAEGAILAQIDGRTVLVLPGRGQPQWILDVVEITSR